MLRFAANLTMMYTEHPFLERFAAAAQDGFEAVEYLFAYDFASAVLASQQLTHSLQQVLFNAPPGDWERGERGLACLRGREDEFRASVARSLEYAVHLDCPCIHVMAGIQPSDCTRADALRTYVANISWAAEQARSAAKQVLIEPINPIDMPGYLLNRQEEAHALIAAIGASNLKVQMDLYHCARVEGDVLTELQCYLSAPRAGDVGHIQIAGFPGRAEPDTGDVDYAPLFGAIDDSNFDGWIGCEYRPAGDTSTGLGWLHGLPPSPARSAK